MIQDLIKDRRSVFPPQYIDMAIPKKNLDQILEAANWAPNHKNTEPWRFKVLQGGAKVKLGKFLSEKYQQIAERPQQVKIKKLGTYPVKSAAVIAICMQRDPKESVPEWEEVAAVAMAVQNMWLTSTEMGIGCYWSSPPLIDFMDEFFDLAEGEKCLGFLYMGYYEEELSRGTRKPVSEKVVWLE
tara:strand:- start:466 stop:1020 length:555 start_codon:yes stop_codon:yes gene_type:complete